MEHEPKISITTRLKESFVPRLKGYFSPWRPKTSRDSFADYESMGTFFQLKSIRFPKLSRTLFLIGFFALSVGIGMSLKSVAHEYLTIGHGDYRLIPAEQLYALNTLREQAIRKGTTLPVDEKQSYPACSILSGSDEEL